MKKGAIAAIVVIVIAVVAVIVYISVARHPAPQPAPPQSAQQQPQPQSHKHPAKPAAASPAEQYCADGYNKSDIQAVKKAGGLVQIFQHEAAIADAYGCAAAYLKHGGNIDAADPRPDSAHLTPLLFAIKRNDPRMVHFMLDHGADPQERGGPKKIRPYGYAVFLALKNRSTDYNKVISIINSALDSDSGSKTK